MTHNRRDANINRLIMPTIFSHPAVPLAIGLGLGQRAISRPLLIAGVAASILPDLDVIAFYVGIPYASDFGHRGFSHSLAFAAIIGLIAACASRLLQSTFLKTFLFLFVATASHGVLDAFTNGGYGIAFLWPFSSERYFAPFQVIQVSPIGASRFLSERGLVVLASEIVWVWLPCIVLSKAFVVWRRKSAGDQST